MVANGILEGRRFHLNNHNFKVLGFTLASVFADLSLTSSTRDLDCVELFSGPATQGAIAKAAEQAGQTAAIYDKLLEQSPTFDITTVTGFRMALGLAFRLRVGGLLWCAPVCSSFCWASQRWMQRSKHNLWQGHPGNRHVADGNVIAAAALFLATIAYMRGVWACVENPPQSRIWSFLRANSMILFPEYTATRDRCCDDVAKQRIRKQYRILSSAPWVVQLRQTCTCPRKIRHLRCTTVRYVNGKQKRTGSLKTMKESGAYLPRFGSAVVLAWLGSVASVADEGTDANRVPVSPPRKCNKVAIPPDAKGPVLPPCGSNNVGILGPRRFKMRHGGARKKPEKTTPGRSRQQGRAGVSQIRKRSSASSGSDFPAPSASLGDGCVHTKPEKTKSGRRRQQGRARASRRSSASSGSDFPAPPTSIGDGCVHAQPEETKSGRPRHQAHTRVGRKRKRSSASSASEMPAPSPAKMLKKLDVPASPSSFLSDADEGG